MQYDMVYSRIVRECAVRNKFPELSELIRYDTLKGWWYSNSIPVSIQYNVITR